MALHSHRRLHKTCYTDVEAVGNLIFARRLIDTVLGITRGNLRMCGSRSNHGRTDSSHESLYFAQ